jgi:hypothetical protein
MIGSNVINLAKVSNVAFKDEFDAKERGRIIFNFCYSIQIKNEIGESIFIPDYKYSDNIDPDVFYSEVESLKSQLKKAGFIEEGRFRKRRTERDGHRGDYIFYGLCSDDDIVKERYTKGSYEKYLRK